MVTEIDLWRTAWIIAEQYGPEGVGFAAEMAQSFEIGGKTDEQRAWLAIKDKVAAITGGDAPPH